MGHSHLAIPLLLLALAGCTSQVAASPSPATTAPATTVVAATQAAQPTRYADADRRFHALLVASSLPTPYEPAYEDVGHAACSAFDAGTSYPQLLDRMQSPLFTEGDVGLIVRSAVYAYCPEHARELPA